jgi:hypothetical protein
MRFNPTNAAQVSLLQPLATSLNGGGDRSRVRDAGQLAPTFGDVEDELQRSASDEIRV